MPKSLTRAQAERVRRIVVKYFDAYTHDLSGQPVPDEDMPRLYRDESRWILVWEGSGPDDWPILVTGGGCGINGMPFEPATFPRGVFAEPINSCELGLYPA